MTGDYILREDLVTIVDSLSKTRELLHLDDDSEEELVMSGANIV